MVAEGAIETVVTHIEGSFGNIRLASGWGDLEAALGTPLDDASLVAEFEGGPREETRYGSTFGTVPVGASVVYVDSLGNLAMADNQGSLATRLDIGPDQPVRISRA